MRLPESGSTPRTLLVVDDQVGVIGSPAQRSFLRNYDELPFTFLFECCADGVSFDVGKAVDSLGANPEVDLVLLDLKFGEDEEFGFRVLKELNHRFATVPVLVMSALDRDVQKLGRALEDGAVGFIEKHRSSAYLQQAVERAIGLMRSHVLLGQSVPLRELRRQAARLAPYDDIPVLIVGERGTGKERVARYIWQSGRRNQGPFIAVNCGGIPDSLFEAEFFGSEKGAFTGSTTTRAGFLERAHGGVLFLDEVGNLPIGMQGKLLRALQDRTFHRIGSETEERRSNAQILSATNADPQQLITEGRLREDFYDRIAAVRIETPTLSDCRGDIELLANHYLNTLVGDRKRFSPGAIGALIGASWPGNVRQLQRAVQEAAVRSEDAALIEIEHLPDFVVRGVHHPASERPPLPEPLTSSRAPSHDRILAELQQMVSLKREIQQTRGGQWRAELVRRLYPHCRAQSAKGLSDAIKRLTQGPWGEPDWHRFPELAPLIEELNS